MMNRNRTCSPDASAKRGNPGFVRKPGFRFVSSGLHKRIGVRAGTVGLFVFGLTACSSLTSVFDSVLGKTAPKASLGAVQVIAESEANQNSATALDVVFVYDTKAVEVLPKTGPEWFQGKAALLAAFPRTIDVVALQVPPAFALDVALPKRRNDAVRVMAYANYLTEAGQKAMDLTSFKRAVIRLKPDAIAFGET